MNIKLENKSEKPVLTGNTFNNPASHGFNSFHLLPDQSNNFARDPLAPMFDAPTQIPRGVSTWDLSSGIPIQLGDKETGTVLEPNFRNKTPRLLIVNFDPESKISVNDQKYGIAALARSGDTVRIGDGPAFEIANYHKANIGPADSSQIGRQCTVCFTEITADSTVLTCSCGSVYHLETDLECALAISTCVQCDSPIRLEDGYYPEPEFISK